MSSTGAPPPRLVLIAFGLIAMSVLLAQVVLSRLFAAIMTYYYAFMLISLAMLGLASGSLLVQLLPRVFTRERFSLNAMIFLVTRDYLLTSVVAAPMATRVGATLLIVAPLGFLMGMPMPIGMAHVAGSQRLVLWGWSLNGVFSVLASVGAIYCAIYWGTSRTFMMAAAAYLLAAVALQVVRRYSLPAARPVTAPST